MNRYPCGIELFIRSLIDSEIPTALSINADIVKETMRTKYKQDVEFADDFYIDKQLAIPDYNLKGIYAKNINYFIAPPKHKNSGNPLCLFNPSESCFLWMGMMDLVAFKPFNDYFGYDAGDMVLAFFCDFVTKELNDNMMVTRKGGEEFLAYGMSQVHENCIDFYSKCPMIKQRAIVEKEVVDWLDKCNGDLNKEWACIFVPKKEAKIKHTLWYDNVCEPEKPKDSSDVQKQAEYKNHKKLYDDHRKLYDDHNDKFLFRFFIKGLEFRYGVGENEKDAEKDMHKRAENETKPRRGEFGKKVKIGFIDRDKLNKTSDNKWYDPKWYDPNKYIFLVIVPMDEKGKDEKLDMRLDEDLAKEICAIDIYKGKTEILRDSLYGTICLVINFKASSGHSNEDNSVDNKSNNEIDDESKRSADEKIKILTKLSNYTKSNQPDEIEKFINRVYKEYERQTTNPKEDEWHNYLHEAASHLVDYCESKTSHDKLLGHLSNAIKNINDIDTCGHDKFKEVVEEYAKAREFDARAAFIRSVVTSLNVHMGEKCKRIFLLNGDSIFDRAIASDS